MDAGDLRMIDQAIELALRPVYDAIDSIRVELAAHVAEVLIEEDTEPEVEAAIADAVAEDAKQAAEDLQDAAESGDSEAIADAADELVDAASKVVALAPAEAEDAIEPLRTHPLLRPISSYFGH